MAFNEFPPSLIELSGGEPFLKGSKWDLKAFLNNIDEKHTIHITSNLSWDLKELEWFEYLFKKKKIRLFCSFHPNMIDINNFISKMKVLKRHKITSSASIVAYPPLFNRLKEFKEKFEKEELTLIISPYIDPQFSYTEEQKRFLIKLQGFYYSPLEFDKNPKDKNCLAGKKYFFLAPNGDAYSCNAGFYYVNSPLHVNWKADKSEFYLGNIFDKTLKLRFESFKCKYPCSEYCDIVHAKPRILKEAI
jgi:hypothetical protein